jgi:hypothetical protein
MANRGAKRLQVGTSAAHKTAVARVSERRPLAARLCRVRRIPASAAHFCGLFLILRDACN